MRRAIDTDITVEDLMAEDADLSIKALLRLCRRAPFAISGNGDTS
jgi:hypothetical protein